MKFPHQFDVNRAVDEFSHRKELFWLSVRVFGVLVYGMPSLSHWHAITAIFYVMESLRRRLGLQTAVHESNEHQTDASDGHIELFGLFRATESFFFGKQEDDIKNPLQQTEEIKQELSESQALEAIYLLLDGPRWTRQTNWLSSHPVSEWEGIQVDSSGHVTAISLPNNGLNGHLSAAIAQLTQLVSIDLSGNSISGQFFSSLFSPL